MFEIRRYKSNANRFIEYTAQLQKAQNSGDTKLIVRLYEQAVSSGSKALELSKSIEIIPDDTTKSLQEALSGVKRLYSDLQQRGYHGTQGLEERLESESIADSIRDDRFVDTRKLFMDIADIEVYDNWTRLAKRLRGRQPTADELIKAYIDAYLSTNKLNPSLGFRDENEFITWLGGLERSVKSQKNEYLQSMLPLYNRLVQERLGKRLGK